MKLSRIYSNKLFRNVKFNDGLNIVIGKVTDRNNSDLDSHSIGKSLLLEVIDFLLLKSINKKEKYFLTRHTILEDYVFFAELKLNSGEYLIIRRATKNNTKISFKLNSHKLQEFQIDIKDWNELDLPIDKAKKKLNDYLAFDVLPNWQYRKSINYFTRYQNDYTDVFKLSKFQGVHKDWKPMIFDILGFDGKLLHEKLDLEDKFKEQKKKLEIIETENSVTTADEDKIVGLIEIKQNEYDKISQDIDRFDFYEKDKEEKEKLVSEIDSQIQDANNKHYSIKYEIDKIEKSISSEVDSFDVSDLKDLYEEVQIFFPNELLNEYEKVIDFNKQITTERNQYLLENLSNAKRESIKLETLLRGLETKKSSIFINLTEKVTYEKFKTYQKMLSKAEANIFILKDKLANINKMSRIQNQIEELDKKVRLKVTDLKSEILKQKHSQIRKLFNEFTMNILNTPSILSVKPNKNNNIDFEADYQNSDEFTLTDLAKGSTYKKILCSAFDTALLQHYNKDSFYKFVYHDGILDSLDIRKKEKYIENIRNILKQNDIQYILTIIESETYDLKDDFKFTEEEVCLILSDESCEGKLFKQCF